MRGDLAHDDTTVTAVDLEAKIPTATVEDCVDLSKWKAERTPSGELIPLPTEQPLRYIAIAPPSRWSDRRPIAPPRPWGACGL
ncbi:hypothetical protein ACFWVP_28845 [Streptomyces sp. NPDC058637]|uniref:hypothetical protein n=1 Tax=Streptomyces sp. NPDC058637 TaxID=3346569 RepID=UPI003661A6CE